MWRGDYSASAENDVRFYHAQIERDGHASIDSLSSECVTAADSFPESILTLKANTTLCLPARSSLNSFGPFMPYVFSVEKAFPHYRA